MNSEQNVQNENVSQHISNEMLQEVPVRVMRSRQKKQESPNGLPIIYVGRPTKWANPFKIGSNGNGVTILTRAAVIELFEIVAKKQLELDPHWLDELKGKNLSCWCGLDEKCHADILLTMANGL
jgi:hypothetical protein